MSSQLISACAHRSGESPPDRNGQRPLYRILCKEMDQLLIHGQQLIRNLKRNTRIDDELADDHWEEINQFLQNVASLWPFWKQEALIQGVKLGKLDCLEKALKVLTDLACSLRQ